MHVIIGTAGHIDHGKSSLVRALTGTDPDRLKEEKERGITTDIGFAFLGDDITIIDVPGHEKFIKNMVAGVSTIDFVMLVIAADDSVMPQTQEHLDILRLLGIRTGMIVLTKIDLVEKEWLEAVREDIQRAVKNTFLETAPVFEVDSVSSRGIKDLKEFLLKIPTHLPSRMDRGVFRFPIDRVFSIKGFGTVVTGSIISGKVKVGDTLELLPQQKEVRVRGLQVHGKNRTSANLGERTALNLVGLEKSEMERGNVLTGPGYFKPSTMMDAKLYLLSHPPEVLVNRQRVRVHMGTMEIMGRVILLDTPEQKPGSESLVQLRLEKKGTAARLDRFVVRRYSPQITIGGGMILDPNARGHKRFDESNIKKLRSLESESPSEVVETKLLSFTEPGMKIDRLRLETNLAEPELEKILNDLESEEKIIIAGEKKQRWVIHQMIFRQIAARTLEVLDQFHKENPFRSGMSKAELKEKAAGRLEEIVWEKVVVELVQKIKIKVHDNRVSNFNFQINLSPGDLEALRRFEKIILEERFNTTHPAEWANKTKLPINDIDKWFAYLLEQGKILRLEGAVCFHTQNVENLRKKLIDFLQVNKKITVAEFKDLIESSRKYAVPLLEYFDDQGLTVRERDFRVLGE